jgi:hypothetical protein
VLDLAEALGVPWRGGEPVHVMFGKCVARARELRAELEARRTERPPLPVAAADLAVQLKEHAIVLTAEQLETHRSHEGGDGVDGCGWCDLLRTTRTIRVAAAELERDIGVSPAEAFAEHRQHAEAFDPSCPWCQALERSGSGSTPAQH